VAGLPPPAPAPPTLRRPRAVPSGAMQRLTLADGMGDAAARPEPRTRPGIAWRWVANKVLLLVEIGLVAGLIWALFSLLETRRELNEELAVVQQAEVAA